MSQKGSGQFAAHKHCRTCGISISPSKEYCSAECREQDESAQKKMRRWRRLSLFMMVAAMALIAAFTILLRPH